MRRLPAVLLVFVSACSSRDAALNLVITTATQRPDSCFEVTVRAPGGDALETAQLPRAAGSDEYDVAIYQGTTFPDDVELEVRAWVADGGCAAPRVANGTHNLPARFTKGLTTLSAPLETLTDADGDFAVALSAGGADCADDAPLRSPFATENCAQAGDFDCDGFSRCTDSECAADCQGVASTLNFTNTPLTVRQGECSGALRVEARDPFGDPAELSSGLSFTGSGVAFYGSSNCTGSVPVAVPLGGASVYASATQPGTVTITASASTSVLSATQPLVVTPLPSIRLISAAAPFIATGCTTQALQLLEIDGGAYISGSPVVVNVTAGTTPLLLFNDCTSRQQLPNVTVSGTANTVFGFSTPRAGALMLTATATGFAPGTVSYLVDPGPTFTATIDAGDPLFAASCNPITVTWADDAGNPTAPKEPVVTTPVQLFSDPGCGDAGVGEPSASMTLYAWPGDQGSAPFTVTNEGVSASTTLNVVRPFPTGAELEIPLLVQTGANRPFNGYDGYSTLVRIDAGTPLPADLTLVRAYFWDSAGWREIDRIYGPLDAGYQFWFQSQGDLGNSISDNHYSFFVMAPGTPPAKASPHEVWLLNEDFESGLSRWTDGGRHWALTTDSGHYSTRSLTNLGNDSGVESTIAPLIPLNERDVAFQAWLRSPNFNTVDVGQQIRVQNTDGGPTWFGHEGAGGDWRTATFLSNGTYDRHHDVNSGTAAPDSDGWSLMLVAMCDNDLLVQTRTGTRSSNDLNPQYGPGTIGFRASYLTQAPLSVDNIVVRRYACPEPYTAVLAPRTAP